MANMEHKFQLVDVAYCFLTRNRATMSVRNVVQMVNGLSAGALDVSDLRSMAAIAPDLVVLHTAQQKQLQHRDDVFQKTQMAPDQLELLTFPSVPQISARASEKRKKLFAAALLVAPAASAVSSTPSTTIDTSATTTLDKQAPDPHASTTPSSPWIDRLRSLDLYRNQIVHMETRAARSATYAPLHSLHLPSAVVHALSKAGIQQLYSHQHDAISATLRGDNVVLSTATASGKSLAFNVPALASLITEPASTFLYLFPTKALAQDQLKALRRLLHATGLPERLCATFDGDTPMKARTMVIRDAQIFLTNPDTLHRTILPKHTQWKNVLANLKVLVVDEAHMYRGVFGAHVAAVFRRLFRLCALHGANPRVVCCSATIRNPETHFKMLFPRLPPRVVHNQQETVDGAVAPAATHGRPVQFDFFYERPLCVTTEDGAPTGEKIYCVWNPKVDKYNAEIPAPAPEIKSSRTGSTSNLKRKRGATDARSSTPPMSEAAEQCEESISTSSIFQSARIFARLVQDEIHTILFCKGRKLSELVLMSVHAVLKESDDTKHLIRRVHTYRGGYTVDDRRRIEQRLFDGELLGVIATNALELGIDIGELDCTMHLGLPSSISSLWQQAGRAGRKHTQQSLAVVVCFDAPLDQHFARHATELFQLKPEAVSLNPHNSKVQSPHLLCAASEHTLFDARSGLAYVDSFIYGAAGLDPPTPDQTQPQNKIHPQVATLLHELMQQKQLLQHHNAGTSSYSYQLHSCASKSLRTINLRSISEINYEVVTDDSEQLVLDTVPGERVFFQLYPTAVYLHQAQEYIITRVDVDHKVAFAKKCTKPLTYFTACRDFTNVEVVKVFTRDQISSRGLSVSQGNVSVTTAVFGTTLYEKRTMRVLHSNEFSLPPMQHFGHALWFELPSSLKQDVEAQSFVWTGALHGVCHLLLAVVPLFVLCDGGDINTEHYNPHEARARRNRVTIYEQREGGSGIVEEIALQLRGIVHRAWLIARECGCVSGCPSCIHSAQCSEYNKVLDKRGSLLVLDFLAACYELES